MKLRNMALCLSLAAVLTGPAAAAETGAACFAEAERFPGGLLVTEVPAGASLRLGTRALRPGDAVPEARLGEVALLPGSEAGGTLRVLSLRDGAAAETAIFLGKPKNRPPAAEDGALTTYKNIPARVRLTVSDPEGGTLTVTILEPPRRGEAQVEPDGSVTYTPAPGKVGRDSFTYRVTDPEGAASEAATVRITILRPSDRETYADLAGDPDLLPATWLRETGAFTGERVGGALLFGPEKPVTRGEFLAMAAALLPEAGEPLTDAGFSDGGELPAWLRAPVTAALRRGCLRGVPTEAGLALDPDSPVTQAQGAAFLARMLALPLPETEAVAALEPRVPAWAAESLAAVRQAELLPLTDPGAALTRRQAARALYQAALYLEGRDTGSLLSWAAE